MGRFNAGMAEYVVFYPVARINWRDSWSSELCVAERVGFEPTVELPRQQFSRLPDSAALAPLRYGSSSAG
jgi:hypothetical protein